MGQNLNTIFCRNLLVETMKRAKQVCIEKGIDWKELKKHAWGYKYSWGDDAEFHINKNPNLPKGFYWHGNASSVTEAKAEGWEAFLEEIEQGRI